MQKYSISIRMTGTIPMIEPGPRGSTLLTFFSEEFFCSGPGSVFSIHNCNCHESKAEELLTIQRPSNNQRTARIPSLSCRRSQLPGELHQGIASIWRLSRFPSKNERRSAQEVSLAPFKRPRCGFTLPTKGFKSLEACPYSLF